MSMFMYSTKAFIPASQEQEWSQQTTQAREV